MRILISFIILCVSLLSYGQNSFFKLYSGSGYDRGEGIVQLEDSSYVITGSSSSWSESSQAFLLKIDAEGNELEVLKGCKLLIKKKKIKSIYIEILNHNLYKNYSKKLIEDFLKKDFYLVNSYKSHVIFAEDRFYIAK